MFLIQYNMVVVKDRQEESMMFCIMRNIMLNFYLLWRRLRAISTLLRKDYPLNYACPDFNYKQPI